MQLVTKLLLKVLNVLSNANIGLFVERGNAKNTHITFNSAFDRLHLDHIAAHRDIKRFGLAFAAHSKLDRCIHLATHFVYGLTEGQPLYGLAIKMGDIVTGFYPSA